MVAIKLYVYPCVQPQVHETTPGFEDTVPLNAIGRAKHCEIVTDPAQAEYFYMGQVADKNVWLLHPNRIKQVYPYFAGNEARHIIDLEGDWRDYDHPEHLSEAIITTGHVRLASKEKFKRRFVRPVMSPLLVRLAKTSQPYVPPEQVGFWFQGQRDSKGLREKVRQAFELAQVPGEWQFNQNWALYLPQDHPLVLDYLLKARRWAYPLCPEGEGPSCRLYEMVLLNRIPVVIGDYEPFCHDEHKFVIQWSAKESVEDLAAILKGMIKEPPKLDVPTMQYAGRLRSYFADPTGYFLNWLSKRGAMKGD